ncbi:VWA domain-containing protein [Acidiferrimicrobium sp. IK]|uniref:vWA domain-containing protein n=1 Tax=Acidiferrimicrobium sp. IK TaxID=2871700 RepID=UPI0021CB6288|nr:vWA domain-containing protein [Acidiferrimicrobium sp. IK]MCU4185358.1 VWA domain-containing protein [Acidiferrimicrobium sp. IK]
MSEPADVDALLAEQSARTTSRREMARAHPRLEQVSPDVGVLDEDGLAELLDEDPDEAATMLADMARATDPVLRAAARAAAARLLIPAARHGRDDHRGGSRRMSRDRRNGMDLDLDATVERLAATARPDADDLRWQAWTRPDRAYVLLVDASGSVTGRPLATAVVTAAAVAARLGPEDQLAVVAFWSRPVVLRPMTAREPASDVLDRLFDLRGGDTTNLAAGLRAALRQAGTARAARREILVLTDGRANEGDDPLPVAGSAGGIGARVHVLELSADGDARAACSRLADAGCGRRAPLARPADAPGAVAAVLAG